MTRVPTARRSTPVVAALAAALAACAGGDTAADSAGESGSARGSADAGAEAAVPDSVAAAVGDSAAAGPGPLYRPESAAMTRRAPDVYRVRFATTEGDFTIQVRRAWAPRGADRLYNLARRGFYDDARFFRVIEGFVAQFGLSGRPELDALWRRHPIRDDSVAHSNERGTVTFASAGENTRTTQLFVNLTDNARLDDMGFAPVGRVVEGMEVVDSLYSGYGEGAPRGAGPSQRRILERGNSYLEEEFSKLDYIEDTSVMEGPAG